MGGKPGTVAGTVARTLRCHGRRLRSQLQLGKVGERGTRDDIRFDRARDRINDASKAPTLRREVKPDEGFFPFMKIHLEFSTADHLHHI